MGVRGCGQAHYKKMPRLYPFRIKTPAMGMTKKLDMPPGPSTNPGPERRISHQLLKVERQEHNASEQAEKAEEHDNVPGSKTPVLENSEIHNRVFGIEFDDYEQYQAPLRR